jgi:hypothetical protein
MFKRRRFKQAKSLEERLAEEAKRIHDEAEAMPPGLSRERLVRMARQAATASRLSEWLRSPGLNHPPSERPAL